MKKIKKQTCNVYRFVNHNGEYKKKLFRRGYTIYDRKARVLKRVDFNYTDVRHMTIDPMCPICLIPKCYLKKPRRRDHAYKYEGDRLIEELFYSTSRYLCQKKLYEYDGNGRLYYSKYFEINGELLWESFYKYDKKGRKREWICNHYSLDDKSTWRYHYDKKGRKSITECDSTLAGYGFYKYKYDENDNIIEEAYYEKPNKLDHIAVYTYNEKGKKIKFEIVSGDGTSGGYVLYVRDKRGNLLESREYDRRLLNIDKSEYNKYGHILSTTHINYYCDCRGVRVVPYQMDVLEYEYY